MRYFYTLCKLSLFTDGISGPGKLSIIFSLREMISLSVSQIFPLTPTWSIGMRTVKFPFLTSVKTVNSSCSS